jgi:hypothetical protein
VVNFFFVIEETKNKEQKKKGPPVFPENPRGERFSSGNRGPVIKGMPRSKHSHNTIEKTPSGDESVSDDTLKTRLPCKGQTGKFRI